MNRSRWLRSSSQYNFFHPAYWCGDVDARPLGIFRIAFAALMLKEAIYHIFVAEIWYSDSGMVPARLLPRVAANTPTLMATLPEIWMATSFFLFWAMVALLLLLGWQTRLMTVLNWVMLVSVINRNPLVSTGADSVMQVFAFWSMFLPLGRCYALDARRLPRQLLPIKVYAFPVRMIQLQIALIYIFTVLFKLQGQTWLNGDALYMAMQVRMHTFPQAEWLLTHAPVSILRILTYMALLVEAGFPILVFAPVFQPYLRGIGLISGVLLHLGIGLVMNIPNFPLVMITGYLMLLDPRWLDWVIKHEQQQATLSAQPIEVQAPAADGCMATLRGIPRAMGQGAYRGLLACVVLGAMFCIIWGNVLNDDRLASRLHVPAMPGVLESSMRASGLWQSWALFAPDPLGYEGWFGIKGIFANGDVYDVRSPLQRPHWYIGPLARWGKLEENLMIREKDDDVFTAWAAYTCQQLKGSNLTGLEIVLYSRLTSAPEQPFLPYTTTVIRSADCTR